MPEAQFGKLLRKSETQPKVTLSYNFFFSLCPMRFDTNKIQKLSGAPVCWSRPMSPQWVLIPTT